MTDTYNHTLKKLYEKEKKESTGKKITISLYVMLQIKELTIVNNNNFSKQISKLFLNTYNMLLNF